MRVFYAIIVTLTERCRAMIRDFINGKKKALSGEVEAVGIGGFNLFAKVNESTTYKATVPTQVLEDGTVVSDDIINDPITIIISGSVGDSHIELAELPEQLRQLQDLTGQISVLLPTRTQSQINKIRAINSSVTDAVSKIDRYIDIGKSAYNLVSGGNTAKSLREKFIDFVEAVYFGKQLIDIEVAYRTFSSMAITSLTVRTDAKAAQTDFEITLQHVETRAAAYTDISEFYRAPSGGFGSSTAGASDKGAQNPKDGKQKSVLSAVLGR